MAEHWPIPWGILIEENRIKVTDANGHVVCVMPNAVPADVANAAFIVTACNSHEDLVKACRNLLEICNTLGLYKGDVRRAARSLAKATGGRRCESGSKGDTMTLDEARQKAVEWANEFGRPYSVWKMYTGYSASHYLKGDERQGGFIEVVTPAQAQEEEPDG